MSKIPQFRKCYQKDQKSRNGDADVGCVYNADFAAFFTCLLQNGGFGE